MPVEAPSPADLTTKDYVEAALLRPLSSIEEGFLPTLIEVATGRLLNRIPTIHERIAAWSTDPRPATAVDPSIVADVLAEVIKRRLVNPKGLWSANETSGPFGRSETYPGARAGGAAGDSPGRLEVTDADIAQITGETTRSRRSPRTARLRPGMAPENLGC